MDTPRVRHAWREGSRPRSPLTQVRHFFFSLPLLWRGSSAHVSARMSNIGDKRNTEASLAVERIAYNAAEACKALGVSSVTLWRLEKRGVLKPIPGLRHRLYSVESLRRFAATGRAA